MYQTGTRVLYGMHGICEVMRTEERIVDGRKMTYLVLEPVGQAGTSYFVPTHNDRAMAKIRSVLSLQELQSLLESEEIRQDAWIMDENRRKQVYRELICSTDRVRLLQMVYALYRQKALHADAGKKIHQCDDNFLSDAEKLLAGELAIVMHTDREQAKQYLREKLK